MIFFLLAYCLKKFKILQKFWEAKDTVVFCRYVLWENWLSASHITNTNNKLDYTEKTNSKQN